MKNYSGAVAQLLTLGSDPPIASEDWADYAALGITAVDIPSLIDMATDADLYLSEQTAPEGWATVHAWRALAQLKAGEAVELLLQAYEQFGEQNDWWEWFSDELPEVLLLMGKAAIPGIRDHLSRRSQSKEAEYSEFVAVEALEDIATAHPDLKPQCIEICIEELQYASKHDPAVNGFLVGVLTSFKAVEAASVIERAFTGGYVDPSISGDWDDIQVELGLKSWAEVRSQSGFVEPARGFRSPARSTEFKGFSQKLSNPKPPSQGKNRKKKK